MLNVVAEMAALTPSGGAEQVMLRLDDEMTGLIEAADTPAGQDGSHGSKSEPASSVPGEGQVVHSTCCTCQSVLPDCRSRHHPCFALLVMTSPAVLAMVSPSCPP